MNFYASPEYLEVLKQVYFPGKRCTVEDLEVDGRVLRLLVVEGKGPLVHWFFLDYHEALPPEEASSPRRRSLHAANVAQGSVTFEEWQALPDRERWMPAPYIDWTRFPAYEDYLRYLKPRCDVLGEQAKRRRRLQKEVGTLVYAHDDLGADVLELSMRWKTEQLRDTQLPLIFDRPDNVEFFRELRRRGMLVAATLRGGDRLLSSWLGVIHQGNWCGWIFARDRDPALKNWSVGRQLLHSAFEDSHRLGHRQFDFGPGDEEYKWKYCTDVRLVGAVGRPPLADRLGRQLRDGVRGVLERYPRAFEAARRVVRRVKNRATLSR